MRHVFDGAKLSYLEHPLPSATRRSNFMRTPDECVKFECRVADGNECSK